LARQKLKKAVIDRQSALESGARKRYVDGVNHRFSGWAAAAVLGPLATISACGSRDHLFVEDDIGETGGRAGGVSSGGGGNTHGGGHAGTASAGIGAFGGTGIGTGGVGFAGSFGTGGVGFAGTFGAGGAFGGTGQFGGNVGFAGVGNSAGTSGFSCAACLAQNMGGNPCVFAECDFVNNACRLVPQNDGLSCSSGDLCAQSLCKGGSCLQLGATACPQPPTPCLSAACDPKTGQCVRTPQTGTACDDGDPCTLADQCVMGKCMPGASPTCKNNDKCCPAGCLASQDNDCHSAPVVVNANNRGWYDSSSFHDAANKNTYTGFSPPFQYNTFFSFDLSGVKGTVVSAQLVLEEESFFGVDASETASVWDVSTSATVLAKSGTTPGVFKDLQSGNQYGTFTGTAKDVGTNLTIPLSSKAVADLNAAVGRVFSVGVHIDTLSGQLQHDEGLRFSQDSETRKHQLVLTVQ
jgi:hypothetical protein